MAEKQKLGKRNYRKWHKVYYKFPQNNFAVQMLSVEGAERLSCTHIHTYIHKTTKVAKEEWVNESLEVAFTVCLSFT
jgi:hypothetical protein